MLINDYLFFDDALEDPDAYVELAKSLTYYNAESQEIPGLKFKPDDENRPLGNWRGHRANSLHELNPELFEKTFNKLFMEILNLKCAKFNFRYEIGAHFNYSPEFVPQQGNKDFWWHQDDDSVYAGLIYLTKNPPKNSGTLMKMNEGEEYCFENVYNRLIMYNGLIMHRPESCFGSTIDDSRLTLTFFVNKLEFQMSNGKDTKNHSSNFSRE